jgi:exosome complex component RRP45
MLDKIFRRSDTIDCETLCILRVAGERVRPFPFRIPLSHPSLPAQPTSRARVWHLRISIHARADAGGLLDRASLACAVSLRYFRRIYEEVLGADDVIVHRPALCALIPLALHHAPYCITFAFYHAPPDLSPSKRSGAAAGARGVTVTEGDGDEMAPRVLLDPAGLEHRLAQGLLLYTLL